jgi:hypothetical protein
MKRLLAIGALCASLATASFAQPVYILTLGGGNVFWNGSDPYVDVPLIFQISAVDPNTYPLLMRSPSASASRSGWQPSSVVRVNQATLPR